MENKDPMVDIKVLKPVGVVLVLLIGVLTVVVCLNVDMGVPEVYESAHEEAYYLQSEDNMQELLEELEENVFPQFDGNTDAWVQDGVIYISADEGIKSKLQAVLNRDFDSSDILFYFVEGTG